MRELTLLDSNNYLSNICHKIVINYRYLLDGLQNIDTSQIIIEVIGEEYNVSSSRTLVTRTRTWRHIHEWRIHYHIRFLE